MDGTVKLVSGGIDSYIMSQWYDGLNVYIDFGQKYAAYEKAALDRLGVKYEEIIINGAFHKKEIFIPDRNLALASIVAMIYEPDVIMLAGLADDNCIDKNPEAFLRISKIISDYANKPVQVISPFFNETKGQIIERFMGKERLRNTFSCYNPDQNGAPCGDCPACLRKAVALETNGIDAGYKLSERIIGEYLKNIHRYDRDRISRFFIYLSKRRPIFAVDLDGILCADIGPYQTRKPILESIKQVNKLDGYIVIYTARLENDRQITEEWLKENGVKYDSLIMNKLPYSTIFDDKAGGACIQ